jgi:hypothetical protein
MATIETPRVEAAAPVSPLETSTFVVGAASGDVSAGAPVGAACGVCCAKAGTATVVANTNRNAGKNAAIPLKTLI